MEVEFAQVFRETAGRALELAETVDVLRRDRRTPDHPGDRPQLGQHPVGWAHESVGDLPRPAAARRDPRNRPSDGRLDGSCRRHRETLYRSYQNTLWIESETREGQWPFAAILSCIDSRTSAELIFDQGLGDVFGIRIAGNFLDEDILGSLEFACHVAGAKLIVVLGHSKCGAINGACDGVELGHLTGLLAKIRPSVAAIEHPSDPEKRTSRNPAFVGAVTRENVRRQVASIPERSTVLGALKESGRIEIVGGVYDIATGAVEFLDA